jgi:mannose-1-phosphate guanylyltransferase/mannose-1-phosphate guanylyltransferase/mannose-6-phosphate isomerase
MLAPVILSGGSGSRLWPLSREGYPKQLLPLMDDERSLFQATLDRAVIDEGSKPPLVICNEAHRFLVAEQASLVQVSLSGIVLEPTARNTAPAVVLAALLALEGGADPVLLVMPSDHLIPDAEAFDRVVQRAYRAAADGQLITFGIKPARAETGYGYIHAPGLADKTPRKVVAFTEKPEAAVAQQYLDAGEYFWNAGIFMFCASVLLSEARRFAPEVVAACEAAFAGREMDADFCRINEGSFTNCPDISLDYAVMEHTKKTVMVEFEGAWSDLGAWDAVWAASDRDVEGNATHGDVLLESTRDCHVHADHRMVAMVGLDGISVVETADAVLVARKDSAQDVKRIVEHLKTKDRSEALQHRRVHRPWGAYDSLDMDDRFQVKRITVKPGEKLSVQMHHHRAEHWVVVSGTARIHLDGEERLLTENQSIYIPLGTVHAFENPGKVTLELIEVQTGSYLGEDDIVRFEDRYGRF